MAYVYRHIRLDKNEPFYIGIGSRINRCYTEKTRNKLWHYIIDKTDYKVDIIFDDITIDEAKEKEKELIALYSKKIDGTGILVNITDGGDGTFGYKHSEETRRKIAESNKKENISENNRRKKSEYAKNRTIEHIHRLRLSQTGVKRSDDFRLKLSSINTGKNHSEETKKKMSISQTGRKHSSESIFKMKDNCHLSKLVLNTSTGIYYISSKEAAFSHNLNPNTIHRYLTGKYKNKTELIYV